MAKKKGGGTNAKNAGSNNSSATSTNSKSTKADRITTGVLVSNVKGCDIHIHSFSLAFHGIVLISDARLELNYGRRYGLVGMNGSGKSTLLQAIAEHDIPLPTHINLFHLDREADACDQTALEWVICQADEERQRLEYEVEMLATDESDEALERLQILYEKLEEIEPDTIVSRASLILHGLGFDTKMQSKKCRDYSGGWRMRIALARALFMKPMLLLLDEPTNHLDIDATVWLEEYLKKYKHILVVISHSQDFLNGVCTNIMHLTNNKRLNYYGGNYDAFVRVRQENLEHQLKRYQWEQGKISNIKDFVNRFGHGSRKLARQAKSREKALERMKRAGLTERVQIDRTISFTFPECGELPPPILQFVDVDFSYDKRRLIYRKLNAGVDLDSRVALVGPNGAGKSTLMKLMSGELQPTNGVIKRHNHLRVGRFHQHSTDQLDLTVSPCEFLIRTFPETVNKDNVRSIVGRWGITGNMQTNPISALSDGQKSRLAFALIAYKSPHILFLDEPTNHLDMESIDALADAINDFDGGLVLVSHDFRLITQVADEIWVCENQQVTKWNGDIITYKEFLRKQIEEYR